MRTALIVLPLRRWVDMKITRRLVFCRMILLVPNPAILLSSSLKSVHQL